MEWCAEKRRRRLNTKARDKVIQLCQLVAAHYLPSIYSHSSPASNKLHSAVWGWWDRVNWWKRRAWTQIRGFPSPGERIATRKVKRMSNSCSRHPRSIVQIVHTFYWCCSDRTKNSSAEDTYRITAQCFLIASLSSMYNNFLNTSDLNHAFPTLVFKILKKSSLLDIWHWTRPSSWLKNK